MTPFAYTIILPTYRRQDVLELCLQHIEQLQTDLQRLEVRVYDNGSPQDSREVVERFRGRLPNLVYTLNEPGHGLGYSLSKGLKEATGERIIELNDDALLPPDFLKNIEATFASDTRIGVVGVRAVEDQYGAFGDGIGKIDSRTGTITGNFNITTDGPVEVDHVYGFCYAYTRTLRDKGGTHDHTLLTQDYSSGNRMETDHCLTAKRLGFKVVYDGRIAVRHLAKPRADMSERSLKWKLNHTRNTLYLFLKHYGLLGNRCLAPRFAFLMDLGLVSLLKKPNKANWDYFKTGMKARTSAFYHYGKHLAGA